MNLAARRALAALTLVFGLASTAAAGPVLDRVGTEIRKQRKLRVQVETTLDSPCDVRLEGTINGHEVLLRKRVRRTGSRRVRFQVRPGRFGVRRPAEDVVFDLRVVVETDDGSQVSQDVDARIPVPVVLLPGLGNELPPEQFDVETMQTFATLLNAARGGVYTTEGRRADLVIHGYPSLEESLPALAKDLHRRVRKVLRRSPFSRVDVVAYSMGGLVARTWSADRGRGRIRNLIFAGTPNEGTPIAYLVNTITPEMLSALLGGVDAGALGGFIDVLLTDASRETIRVFYPTYGWVEGPFGASNPAGAEAPLVTLNAIDPDPAARFHGLAYTDVAGDGGAAPFGTLESIDLLSLAAVLGGQGGFDLTALADGSGDMVVPARSVFMTDEPAWAARIATHDMGAGTHFTLLADPAVLARIVSILAQDT